MRSDRHSLIRTMCLLLCGLLVTLGGAADAQITLPANTVITASTTTYDNKDIIVDGGVTGTATIDGRHPFNSLVVQNNGVVTHDPPSSSNFAGGMNLVIAKDCTITVGSAISASSKGWTGGSSSLPAQGPGAGGSDVFGGTGGGGAYGGEALPGNTTSAGIPYDDLTLKAATDLGSGGGSGANGAYAGGAGGGAIQMTVGGTLQVNGQFTADGGSSNFGGGGSGGSLYLDVGTLSGSGLISASGGSSVGNNYSNGGGGGSGGRIAIYYTTNSFATPFTTTYPIRAVGGSGGFGAYAGAGTIFLQQAGQKQGDLWVHNSGNSENYSAYTPLQDALNFDDVYVWGQGVLTSQPENPLSLNVLNNVTVAVDGRISVSSRGYPGGFGPFLAEGPGAGDSDVFGGTGGGGAYGGEALPGNTTSAGIPYDDLTLKAATDLGSGGGSGANGAYAGGAGGGAIQMTVGGTLQVNGQFTADGGSSNFGGGGSGGSLYLDVGTLSGSGLISASGGSSVGNNYSNGGGGGSGGRIAIYYTTNSFATPFTTTYPIRAVGGSGGFGAYAGAGTVFLQQAGQTQGDLWVHNNGSIENANAYTPLQDALNFDDVYVWGQGVLAPTYGTPLALQVLGTFHIGVDGSINATGRGYPGGYGSHLAGGPGAGSSDASGGSGGGGGGYGGAGDAAYSGGTHGGTTYGSATMPTDLGSGGGSGYAGSYAGGDGGGAIHLIVNGILQVDGHISADGVIAANGGCGSGGSLWLVTNTLNGSGLISANGGNQSSSIYYGYNGGGGGGGGRIAIYAYTNNFSSGTISATGGSDGGGTAGAGSVNIYPTSGISLQALTLTATPVPEGQTTIGSVTLSGPAPAGGVTIALTANNTTVASIPPSVTVPTGKQGATFTIKTKALSKAANVTITASLGGIVQSVTLNVEPWIAGVTLNPTTVPGGSTSTGTVTLNFPAPQNGLPVGLVSGNTAVATVPSSTTVAQGATSATFTVTTSSSVATETPVTIAATYGPEAPSSTLYVDPSAVALKGFALTPPNVVGGNLCIGTVSLMGKAPAGGAVVSLTNSNPSLISVPATITIPQGRSSIGFAISTPQVTDIESVTLSATLGTSTKSGTLKIQPTGVASLVLIPDSLKGGVETSVGVVTLMSAVQVDTVVKINSNSSYAIPDTTVVIPAGELVGFFNIDTATNNTGKAISATITATAHNISAKAILTVN